VIVEQDALVELDIEPIYWRGTRRVACFRAQWKDQDCFFLVPRWPSLRFPMSVETLWESSVLTVTAGSREVLKDRYFDEDGGQRLLAAFEAHLDVEYAHAL
jgi:hypothetical protein